MSRADYLKAWATGFDAGRIPYYDYRDEKIDVFGETALLRSTNKGVRMIEGKEVVGMTMYTDIYVRRDGAWKCIQAQITPVTPAHYPPDDTICGNTSRVTPRAETAVLWVVPCPGRPP